MGGIKKTRNDYLWSDLIRGRAKWRCEYCFADFSNDKSKLDAAHIHTVFYDGTIHSNIAKREKWSTRNDPNSGISLCRRHHQYYDGKHGFEKQSAMITWISVHLPKKRIEILLSNKNRITPNVKSKVHQRFIQLHLENELKTLGIKT